MLPRPLMKLREIERLRAVAVLMTMVMHWDCLSQFLPPVARQSWSGVDLFFVISGYVVTLSLVRLLPPLEGEASFVAAFEAAKQALKTFYTRRFFRILPAALAVLLLNRFLLTIYPQTFGSPQEWFAETIAFFGGVYNYAHAYHRQYVMGPYWSLSVEEHFYLLLPVLFVVCRTKARRLAGCLAVALVSIVARAVPHADGMEAPDFYEKFASHLRFDSLMAGVALALMASHAPSQPIMPKWLMRFAVLPACVVLIACLPGAAPDHVMLREGFIALYVLSALLVGFGGMDQGYVLSFPIIGRLLEYIGARSYALYLVHLTIIRLDDDVRQEWPKYAQLIPRLDEGAYARLAVVFGATLIVAEVLHQVIEKPFIRLGKRLIDPELRATHPASPRVRALFAAAGVLAAAVYWRHGLLALFGPKNIALHAAVTASSHEDGKPQSDALTNGELESEFGLHTKREDEPWATIDLGSPHRIGAIRVYNRLDGYQDEALPLELSVSDDGQNFRVIARRERMFTQAFPWRIRVGGDPVRYVRVGVPRTTPLCLSEVEIFEERWMAALP
jgi:peptidoglycan/LPS O-acetylase OafA/YrhL